LERPAKYTKEASTEVKRGIIKLRNWIGFVRLKNALVRKYRKETTIRNKRNELRNRILILVSSDNTE
jgi:hypothetical protein